MGIRSVVIAPLAAASVEQDVHVHAQWLCAIYSNHTRQCSPELVAHKVSTYCIHHNARRNLVPVKLHTARAFHGYLNVLLYYDKFSSQYHY